MGHLSTRWPLLSQSVSHSALPPPFVFLITPCHVLSTRCTLLKAGHLPFQARSSLWDFSLSSFQIHFLHGDCLDWEQTRTFVFWEPPWAKAGGGIGGGSYSPTSLQHSTTQLQPQSSSLFSQIRPHTKKYSWTFKRTHSISPKTFLFFS